jgi:hypothetical protein
MKKTASLIFWLVILILPCLAGSVVPAVIKDSKPANISIIDKVLLKPVTVRIGASKMNVLVNRLTDKVEYVWSNVYKRYVRPKYTMINAQILYDQFRN